KALKTKIENVYVIGGEDAFLRNRALNKIKKALDISYIDLNSVVINGGNIDEIINACRVMPFMSKKRLVVAYEFYDNKNIDVIKQIEKLAQQYNDSCLIIVNSEMDKIAKAMGVVYVDCKKMDSNLLAQWVTASAKNANKRITPLVVKKIVEYCNNDMSKIDSETKKLNCFCEDEITMEAVELIVVKDTDYAVYALTNNIAEKNLKEALLVLWSLLSRGEEPTALVSMMYSMFKRMFFSKNTTKSVEQTAKLLGVKEYAVQKARENAVKFGGIKLRKAMSLCLNADEEMKTSNVSKNDRLELLVLQVVNL
ncbi:MAG: DNA polymerase III subunit delta, partial [Clostridia bacterium]